MRILMVGDIVGRPGRLAAKVVVPALRSEHDVDFVVANGENAAAGMGLTAQVAAELLGPAEIDVITLGNHAWAKKEVYAYLDTEPRVLRPANYPAGVPGRGWGVFTVGGAALGVLNLQGRTFMDPVDDPFALADEMANDSASGIDALLIDFHAEATSEKQAMFWHMDGRASAIVGTHTHVQTADESISEAGTAYITDVGMTGPTVSILGMRPDTVLPRFVTQLPSRFEVADGPALLSAVLIDIDPSTGRATSIRRIQRRPNSAGSELARPCG